MGQVCVLIPGIDPPFNSRKTFLVKSSNAATVQALRLTLEVCENKGERKALPNYAVRSDDSVRVL